MEEYGSYNWNQQGNEPQNNSVYGRQFEDIYFLNKQI